MSKPARTSPSRGAALSRAAALICALALATIGVSVSSAQTPAPPATTSQSAPPKLNPFPVVTIAGRQGKSTTTVTELSVRGPFDALVTVRCLGEECPLRRVRARIPGDKRVRMRRAERVYRAGTSIEIRVTRENRVGKYTKIRFRAGRTPTRSDACLQPGATRPSPCPD